MRTAGKERRVRRWEHEHVLDAMKERLARRPELMQVRRLTVEHVFGTIKHWMGAIHFLTRKLANVGTEISLQVLAYNLKRMMNVGTERGTAGGGPVCRSIIVKGITSHGRQPL
jgi:hypothetical protein